VTISHPARRHRSGWSLLVALSAIACPALAEPPATPAQLEFFESRIRPLLIESCYRCHSTESGRSRGGLLLDTRQGLLQGGDTGPALVPGDPDSSLLIKAVRYTDKELQMPPGSAGGRLPPERIEELEAWVRLGAPDPRTDPATPKAEADRPAPSPANVHWAFQRVVTPPLPPVQDAAWVRTPMDAFILAKLEARGLRPAPPADRRTLLRRVTFDLTGLPPTPEDLATFLADPAPDAYERVVDRLLASPRYGERWGRHWLDVARYADTKGYVFQEERRFAFSYTYRDYVIAAFNGDLPYDRFLLEQIAGDRLLAESPPPGDANRAPLAALGFLTLGRRFLNNQNDIIDDRIDVVMRGTQGLTVGCARCHDHKFDPISMGDYYALHGVFASSREPEEKPLLGKPVDPAQHEAFLKAKAEIEARRETVIAAEVEKWLAEQRGKSADYLRAAQAAIELPADASLETFAGEHKLAVEVLREWVAYLKRRGDTHAPIASTDAPPDLPAAEVRRIIARHLDNQTVKHRQELAALEWQHPGAPARAMALEDLPEPHNSRIFIRGNPGNPGAEVPRRFVAVLAGPASLVFTNGSGRLELARAIASRDNPLTARVFVNRVWSWRFGTPLVATPSDFGIRTTPPEHRDLLDWLAASFMDQGWSIKQLHRVMLLSSTYRQASLTDPENRLLHCFPRQRLDFEALRDALLAVSGKLDLTPGGQPVDILGEPFSGRRTVYGFIDRQNLPGIFRTFDFANPDVSSAGRFTTTVPQQALFLMNSPFVIEQARALAAAVESPGDAPPERIHALYARTLQRAPAPDELELALAFVNRAPSKALAVAAGWQYGTGRFDDQLQATADFVPMTTFTAGRVSPAAEFPLADERGYASLSANGGHPGNTPRCSVIRRWIAPTDGVIHIEGRLSHGAQEGDGVRGRVVRAAGGLVAEWNVFHAATNTAIASLPVQRGEALDFMVDCVGSPAFDSFSWAPTIRLEPRDRTELVRTDWRADADFGPPTPPPTPLTPFAQLAQVLLLSNEFAFVD